MKNSYPERSYDDQIDERPTFLYSRPYGKILLKGGFYNDTYHEDLIDIKFKAIHHLHFNPKLTVYLQLTAVDTDCLSFLLDLFKQLQVLSKINKEIKIFWIFESAESQIREIGLQFKSIYTLEFEVIPA